jgi:DNA-3-methyladenine glycosylase I
MSEEGKKRCFGGPDDPLMMRYHDEEWGVPSHDVRHLFELLVLEGAQAGLSWQTILNKRENYRKAFDNFDPAKVAAYGDSDRERLLADAGIVRNRLKIQSAISNAESLLNMQMEPGGFDRFIWAFTGNVTIRATGVITTESIPAKTVESEAMSRELRSRGFRFVGPTICYAFMQAAGMVNDHVSDCFRAPVD